MSKNQFTDPQALCANKTVNRKSKEMLLDKDNIDALSKAITHHIFRNGPVEDMHTEGKLTQEDMKTLNKYMVNRLAGLFAMAQDGQWAKLLMVYEKIYKYSGGDWDAAQPDTDEIEAVFKDLCLDTRKPL